MALDKLTPKQEEFVAHYLINRNGMEAYRTCYDCDNMKPASINRAVTDLLNHPVIAARVAACRAKLEAKTDRSLEKHLLKLEELRDGAHSSEEYNAAIKAENLIGQCLGYYTQKVEVTGRDGKPLNPQIKDTPIPVLIAMYEKTKREVEEAGKLKS